MWIRPLSLTWAPTVQAGPASGGTDVTIAFYHNKDPNYSDRATVGLVKAKAKMLECKLVVSGEINEKGSVV